MEYVISKKQKTFIHEHFFQWSFGKPDEYVPNKDKFKELNDPEELHYLACIYNWDDGALVLEWILDSPLCTRSTANFLFWSAAPDYYLEFDLGKETECPTYNIDGLRVIEKVVKKYIQNSFSKQDIEFDPKNVIEEITTKESKWEIPKGVYDRVNGIKVIGDELLLHFNGY